MNLVSAGACVSSAFESLEATNLGRGTQESLNREILGSGIVSVSSSACHRVGDTLVLKYTSEFINSAIASPRISEEFHHGDEFLEPRCVFDCTNLSNSSLATSYLQVPAIRDPTCAEFLLMAQISTANLPCSFDNPYPARLVDKTRMASMFGGAKLSEFDNLYFGLSQLQFDNCLDDMHGPISVPLHDSTLGYDVKDPSGS